MSDSDIHIICERLYNEINHPNFSRRTLINAIMKLRLKNRFAKKMSERISWLYLKSCSLASDSEFYVSNSAYKGMIEKSNLDL